MDDRDPIEWLAGLEAAATPGEWRSATGGMYVDGPDLEVAEVMSGEATQLRPGPRVRDAGALTQPPDPEADTPACATPETSPDRGSTR